MIFDQRQELEQSLSLSAPFESPASPPKYSPETSIKTIPLGGEESPPISHFAQIAGTGFAGSSGGSFGRALGHSSGLSAGTLGSSGGSFGRTLGPSGGPSVGTLGSTGGSSGRYTYPKAGGGGGADRMFGAAGNEV